MDFKPGDVVRHKATWKRCVISSLQGDGVVRVTTEDGEKVNYHVEELEPYDKDHPESVRM
jgi:uncharacterized protein YodC (DUF2158 family)